MGIGLFFGFVAYVYSMLNTSVANVNFIMTTQVIFLSVFGFIFLKEKFGFVTFFSVLIAKIKIYIPNKEKKAEWWSTKGVPLDG